MIYIQSYMSGYPRQITDIVTRHMVSASVETTVALIVGPIFHNVNNINADVQQRECCWRNYHH